MWTVAGGLRWTSLFCLTQCLETPTLAVVLSMILLSDSSNIRILGTKIRVFGRKLGHLGASSSEYFIKHSITSHLLRAEHLR